MVTTCKDPVFGEMTYTHSWHKMQEETIFGNKYKIDITASAYSGKSITDGQRAAYEKFENKKTALYNCAGKELIDYVNTNLDELAEYWPAAKKIEGINDLIGVVEPTVLLFKQDGTAVLLLECAWDEENGVGVKLLPDVEVGAQDMFL